MNNHHKAKNKQNKKKCTSSGNNKGSKQSKPSSVSNRKCRNAPLLTRCINNMYGWKKNDQKMGFQKQRQRNSTLDTILLDNAVSFVRHVQPHPPSTFHVLLPLLCPMPEPTFTSRLWSEAWCSTAQQRFAVSRHMLSNGLYPFAFTMSSHGIIYVSHRLLCVYSASELLLDRMGFCIWQHELFEVDDWCLPAVAVLWAGQERVMFSERHMLVWFESIRSCEVASETHCSARPIIRCHYVLSFPCAQVLSLTLLNIRVSVLHTML